MDVLPDAGRLRRDDRRLLRSAVVIAEDHKPARIRIAQRLLEPLTLPYEKTIHKVLVIKVQRLERRKPRGQQISPHEDHTRSILNDQPKELSVPVGLTAR